METVLGIFCKQPIPGKVKTRLAKDIGDEPAARLYEAFLKDIVERLREMADQRILYFAPTDTKAAAYFEELSAGNYQVVPQPDGDLGHRLARFFTDSLRDGPHQVIAIGSDTPTITNARIREAYELLGRWEDVPRIEEAVLGRSYDGGYYLIGLRTIVPGLFDGVDWSTPAVYDQQWERLVNAGFHVRVVGPTPEVDTIDDLARLRESRLLPECATTYRVLNELDLL